MPNPGDLTNTAQGQAALSICESLLIALNDLNILSAEDARDLLTDAAATHRGASGSPAQVARHEEVATIIEHICALEYAIPH